MDDGEAGPEAGPGARDEEPSVLGRLPTSRPQHRSVKRGTSPKPKRVAAPTRPTSRTPRRRPAPSKAAAPDGPKAGPPTVDSPPPAPRSGWATPGPDVPSSAPLPPLAALVDGAVRSGEQLVRGVLRRLPFR